MSLKTKAVITAVSTLLLFGAVRYCDRDRVIPTEPGKLAPNERERIEFKDRVITIIKADKTVKAYAPGGAKVRVRKDGSIDVDIKRMGFCHEPGMGVAYTGEGKLKLSLDVKLAYYRRLGGNLGLTVDFGHKYSRPLDAIKAVKPMAVASYAVPSGEFPNTSFYVGAELFPVVWIGGMRLQF